MSLAFVSGSPKVERGFYGRREDYKEKSGKKENTENKKKFIEDKKQYCL